MTMRNDNNYWCQWNNNKIKMYNTIHKMYTRFCIDTDLKIRKTCTTIEMGKNKDKSKILYYW